jgi:hypothetical protein
MAHLWGVQITEHNRLWIKEQLLKKGLRYKDVARKTGGSPYIVYDALSGRRWSKRAQSALAAVLGYGSFEELLETCRQTKGGAA